MKKIKMEEKPTLNSLCHFGVLGMKWGVRKDDKSSGSRSERIKDSFDGIIKKVGAKINPNEFKYGLKRAFNKVEDLDKFKNNAVQNVLKQTGLLTTDESFLKSTEKIGIDRQKRTIYDNLDDNDLANLKRYTDSARFSRNVNRYLAIGEPQMYAKKAEQIKSSLSKNKLEDLTVFRSCSLKFSMSGSSKMNMNIEEMQAEADRIAKNFIGKHKTENRIMSTSTSPLFAIDTWRKVNPTAAASYNCYMIINCKGTPGVLADGRTSKGKKLVNTRSNQEAILAPNRLTYKNLRWDPARKMYALSVDAD